MVEQIGAGWLVIILAGQSASFLLRASRDSAPVAEAERHVRKFPRRTRLDRACPVPESERGRIYLQGSQRW